MRLIVWSLGKTARRALWPGAEEPMELLTAVIVVLFLALVFALSLRFQPLVHAAPGFPGQILPEMPPATCSGRQQSP